MKRIARRWASAAILASALAPTAATAEWSDSLYVSLGGLYVLPATSSYSSEWDDGYTSNAEVEFASGTGIVIAVGTGEDVGLRGELEFGYRKIDYDKMKYDDEAESIDLDGDQVTLSFMANGLYAFDISQTVRPYFGVGLGMAKHESTGRSTSGENSDDDTVFAYQGMAGVGFALAEQTEVRVGYRYFATQDANFGTDGYEFDLSYGSHSVEAGIRFSF